MEQGKYEFTINRLERMRLENACIKYFCSSDLECASKQASIDVDTIS